MRAYASEHNIKLVATPTYASYLNPVECHFSALSQLVVANTDYLAGTPSRSRSLATSTTATAITATAASSPPKPATASAA
jgi:hypothetical protein